MTTYRQRSWMSANWRPIAAFVYLGICLFDFMLMPMYYEYTYSRVTPERIAEIALKFDGAAQVETIRILRSERAWAPLTLQETGLFHLSFGAILGAAAWTRNRDIQTSPEPNKNDS